MDDDRIGGRMEECGTLGCLAMYLILALSSVRESEHHLGGKFFQVEQ